MPVHISVIMSAGTFKKGRIELGKNKAKGKTHPHGISPLPCASLGDMGQVIQSLTFFLHQIRITKPRDGFF